jgi:hypothetical protein
VARPGSPSLLTTPCNSPDEPGSPSHGVAGDGDGKGSRGVHDDLWEGPLKLRYVKERSCVFMKAVCRGNFLSLTRKRTNTYLVY